MQNLQIAKLCQSTHQDTWSDSRQEHTSSTSPRPTSHVHDENRFSPNTICMQSDVEKTREVKKKNKNELIALFVEEHKCPTAGSISHDCATHARIYIEYPFVWRVRAQQQHTASHNRNYTNAHGQTENDRRRRRRRHLAQMARYLAQTHTHTHTQLVHSHNSLQNLRMNPDKSTNADRRNGQIDRSAS